MLGSEARPGRVAELRRRVHHEFRPTESDPCARDLATFWWIARVPCRWWRCSAGRTRQARRAASTPLSRPSCCCPGTIAGRVFLECEGEEARAARSLCRRFGVSTELLAWQVRNSEYPLTLSRTAVLGWPRTQPVGVRLEIGGSRLAASTAEPARFSTRLAAQRRNQPSYGACSRSTLASGAFVEAV